MKQRFRRVFIATTMMVAALTSGIFAACSYENDQEAIKKEEGYSYCVTYDANGGTFGSNSTRTYALVKENSLTPAPGYVDQKTQATVKLPTRRDYQLIDEVKDDGDEDENEEAILTRSWFVAKTDDKGNVIYEGEGENKVAVLESETPWNFAKDKVTKDITLVAQWREVFRFTICLVDTDAEGARVEKEIRTYSVDPGDTIGDKLYNKDKELGTIVRRADYIKVSVSNYTLLDFYMDEAFTQPFALDYQHPGRHEEQETVINPETKEEETTTISTNVVKIYVKYLSGRYDLISNKNLKTLSEASKWYLLEDVDYTGKNWSSLDTFGGVIYGNGYTIKNLTVESIAMKPNGAYNTHSIFGKMNGSLQNVKFDNVTLNVRTQYGTKVPGEQRASFIAYDFGKNGQLTDVEFNNCRILYTHASCYTHLSAGNSGLWWEAPESSATQNVVIKNAESIQIVEEE